MTALETLNKLKKLGKPTKKNLDGMARFGIRPKTKVFCVSVPNIRNLAKTIGKNNELACELWKMNVHEAQILAGMIAEPEKATEKQIEEWVHDFDTWDVCDSVCSNFIDKTRFAWKNLSKWSKSEEEFVKRTAFTLMATLAVHDRVAKNEDFLKLFLIIKKGAIDERNFVMKAVNWAIRQIGKRNMPLRSDAIKLSKELLETNSKSAKWIARGALRELNDPKIIDMVKSRNR